VGDGYVLTLTVSQFELVRMVIGDSMVQLLIEDY